MIYPVMKESHMWKNEWMEGDNALEKWEEKKVETKESLKII